MPCSDYPPENYYRSTTYENEIKNLKDEVELQKSKKDLQKEIADSAKEANVKLEAVICALMNELERREDGQQIMMDAEKNGQVEILPIWREHLKKDIQRMQRLLDELSNDERDLIKQMLNGEI